MTPHTPLYLGIDFGTSGCRAIVIDHAAAVKGSAKIDYPPQQYQAPYHQQQADMWWSMLVSLISQLAQTVELQQLQRIAIDGTSATVLLVDEHGTAKSPALMYNDARAINESEQIRQLTAISTNSAVMGPSSGLAKALWLSRNFSMQATDCVLHQADWIIGKLTGNFRCSDANNALKTGYDSVKQRWPEDLATLGITTQNLPQVLHPGTVINGITPSAARATGLAKHTLVVAGTTDSTAAVMASGASKPGDAISSLGSTLVVKIISQQAIFNTDHGIYSQPYGKFWLVGGASNTGGAVLRKFFTNSQMTKMTPFLNFNHPTGLKYYPLSSPGERFPINDATYPPCLTPRPENDVVFFQAILEAIASIEYRGYKRLQQFGSASPQRLFSCGGGSQNRKWSEMRAKLLKIPLFQPKSTEAAYGAALLALQSDHET